MKCSEVIKKLNMPRSTIRSYERCGLLGEERKREAQEIKSGDYPRRYRHLDYTEEEFRRLKGVSVLKSMGFGMGEIMKIMDENSTTDFAGIIHKRREKLEKEKEKIENQLYITRELDGNLNTLGMDDVMTYDEFLKMSELIFDIKTGSIQEFYQNVIDNADVTPEDVEDFNKIKNVLKWLDDTKDECSINLIECMKFGVCMTEIYNLKELGYSHPEVQSRVMGLFNMMCDSVTFGGNNSYTPKQLVDIYLYAFTQPDFAFIEIYGKDMCEFMKNAIGYFGENTNL